VSNNIDLFIPWTSLHVVVDVVAGKTCLLLLGGRKAGSRVELEEDDVSVFNDVGPAHLTVFAGSLGNQTILCQSESPVLWLAKWTHDWKAMGSNLIQYYST